MSFIETLKNEIYLTGISRDIYGKGNKYLFYDNKIPFLRNCIVVNILKILFPVLYFLYVIFNVLVSCIRKLGVKYVKIQNGNYFFAVDNFSKALNTKINNCTKHSDVIWILNSNVHERNYHIIGDRYLSVYNLVNIKDILTIAQSSYLILYEIYVRLGSHYILYALNSYKWFLFKIAADKIPKQSTIYFFNQKDRWALLVDKLDVKHKVLIQHGTLIGDIYHNGYLTVTDGMYCQDMPYKLGSVTKVFALSDNEFKAMCLSILSNIPTKAIMNMELELTEISHEHVTVLIIGCQIFYGDKEKEFISKLQHPCIDIYLKAHPTQSAAYYKKLEQYLSFHLITNDFFPHVDIVISYDSTLALEYRNAGINVLYHTKMSVDNIISKIEEIIRKKSLCQSLETKPC